MCFSYALHKEVGSVQSAKDLTFVSVRDSDGRPIRDASSVEVWNTQKNNIKAYPVIRKKNIIILATSTFWPSDSLQSIIYVHMAPCNSRTYYLRIRLFEVRQLYQISLFTNILSLFRDFSIKLGFSFNTVHTCYSRFQYLRYFGGTYLQRIKKASCMHLHA